MRSELHQRRCTSEAKHSSTHAFGIFLRIHSQRNPVKNAIREQEKSFRSRWEKSCLLEHNRAMSIITIQSWSSDSKCLFLDIHLLFFFLTTDAGSSSGLKPQHIQSKALPIFECNIEKNGLFWWYDLNIMLMAPTKPNHTSTKQSIH